MLRTGSTAKIKTMPTWALMLMAFLVFVLCIHFLIEDLSFASTHITSSASYPNQSEITHQDDLVQFTELSSVNFSNPAIQIIPVLLTVQESVFFPHFNPPNI